MREREEDGGVGGRERKKHKCYGSKHTTARPLLENRSNELFSGKKAAKAEDGNMETGAQFQMVFGNAVNKTNNHMHLIYDPADHNVHPKPNEE